MKLYTRDTFSSKKLSLIIKEKKNHKKSKDENKNLPPSTITISNKEHEIAYLNVGQTFTAQNNCDQASDWLARSAEQGNMEAQLMLGDLYALGHGISKSTSDAYKWYTKAAIQGYKKALIRIHNLYQEDIKMHCRGQINSDEDGWADAGFKKKNKIRELNEYRLEQKKHILNGAISYYTTQFKVYQSSNQTDPSIQLNLAFLYQHGYGVKKCIKWAFEYYEMAAEQGNTDAQYNLGNLYQKHTNMKFYYRHAFKWFTESAQGGNRVAQRSLAYFYLKGLATEINDIAAYTLYTKAAEAGDTEAMVTLGKLYRKGECVKQDLQKAVHWYTCAARQGNIVAQNCLSQLHQRGMLNSIEIEEDMPEYIKVPSMKSRLCTKLSIDVSKVRNSPKQLKELSKRALIGDGQAMYEIGLKYLKGDGEFAQDEDTGMKWIKNAATAKHKGAQLLIAEMYRKGDVVEQDYHKAAIWYKVLTKQKNAAAQFNVGVMYTEGLGVRKDPLEASKWFIWAADQGSSDAKFSLSIFRSEGVGLHQDRKEALKLLKESAHQGNDRGCYVLGKKYISGDGIEMDTKLGLALLKYAAKNGNVSAQMQLAFKYKYGDIVDKDMESCIQYYTMASDSGNPEAKYELGLIYLNGNGVNCNYLKAYRLFKQAEDEGHVRAKQLFQDHSKRDQRIDSYFRVINMFIKATKQGMDELHYNIGCIYQNCLEPFGSFVTKTIKSYKIASKKGDARADCSLGELYQHGHLVKKKVDAAIVLYEKASKSGNADASSKLANMYFEGKVVTQDLLKAYHYFAKEYNMGNQQDYSKLTLLDSDKNITTTRGFLLEALRSPGKPVKSSKIKMLEKATEEGLTRLQYQLGLWYENENYYEGAFKWFKSAAEIGVTDAYYRLGVFYEEGKGVEQDYVMAAKMYQKATEKDHENACYRLGQLYQFGNGVDLDYLKAYQLYKKADNMGHTEAYKVLNITLEPKMDSNRGENALDPSSQKYQDSLSMCRYVAEQGHTDVQFKVGFAYEYCIVEPIYVEAYKWYSLAAEKSHREASYHLGLLYEKGLGTRQNYQNAIQLYEQASQLGSDGALYRLGHLYHYGKGVTVNLIKAVEYYTHSANLGNPNGQCELGKLYEEGKIVQKNPLEALKWYTKAYVQGYDPIRPQLYAMYNEQPYEDFVFKKLFHNIYVASCGHFRLTKKYYEDIHRDLNNRLGIFCALGYGTDKNVMKAWEYFTKKYDGYDNTFELSDILGFGYGLTPIEKGSILKALEEDEDYMNQIGGHDLCVLAKCFMDGVVQTMDSYTTIDDYDGGDLSRYLITGKDYSSAFTYLKLAAEKDYPRAFFLLGIMYHCGYNVHPDSKQGEMYFKKAVDFNIKFMEQIALLYHTHKGMRNFKKAYEWYNRALDNFDKFPEDDFIGDVYEILQVGLGLLYEYGDGVQQDIQKALACYKELADNYQPVACYRLALLYYYGKGVPVDYFKAFDLFNSVVDSGIWNRRLPFVQHGSDSRVYRTIDDEKLKGEGCYWLGLMYKNGQGVFQDYDIAQSYFVWALKYKCKRARNEVENYNSKLY